MEKENINLYKCCNTCMHKDNSYYGCTKADACYNGFSAYSPNKEIQNTKRIIKGV